MSKYKLYCTTFCNKPHRLEDGKPVEHECFIIPTAALHAEREGDMDRANDILRVWTHRRVHKGVRSKSYKEEA